MTSGMWCTNVCPQFLPLLTSYSLKKREHNRQLSDRFSFNRLQFYHTHVVLSLTLTLLYIFFSYSILPLMVHNVHMCVLMSVYQFTSWCCNCGVSVTNKRICHVMESSWIQFVNSIHIVASRRRCAVNNYFEHVLTAGGVSLEPNIFCSQCHTGRPKGEDFYARRRGGSYECILLRTYCSDFFRFLQTVANATQADSIHPTQRDARPSRRVGCCIRQ